MQDLGGGAVKGDARGARRAFVSALANENDEPATVAGGDIGRRLLTTI